MKLLGNFHKSLTSQYPDPIQYLMNIDRLAKAKPCQVISLRHSMPSMCIDEVFKSQALKRLLGWFPSNWIKPH